MGSSEQAAAADNSTTRSFVKGVFTLATQKTVELRHRVATAVATYGFGVASSMSVIEVYAQIEIRKIA
jgi:ATP-dependent Clp protease adapter protein ClpS